MTEWEHHFQKLQYGLTFDENNPNEIENSENENHDKNLSQNDAGPSRNKSYDKYKTYSLDECVKKMVTGLQTIQKHMNQQKEKNVERPI